MIGLLVLWLIAITCYILLVIGGNKKPAPLPPRLIPAESKEAKQWKPWHLPELKGEFNA